MFHYRFAIKFSKTFRRKYFLLKSVQQGLTVETLLCKIEECVRTVWDGDTCQTDGERQTILTSSSDPDFVLKPFNSCLFEALFLFSH